MDLAEQHLLFGIAGCEGTLGAAAFGHVRPGADHAADPAASIANRTERDIDRHERTASHSHHQIIAYRLAVGGALQGSSDVLSGSFGVSEPRGVTDALADHILAPQARRLQWLEDTAVMRAQRHEDRQAVQDLAQMTLAVGGPLLGTLGLLESPDPVGHVERSRSSGPCRRWAWARAGTRPREVADTSATRLVSERCRARLVPSRERIGRR